VSQQIFHLQHPMECQDGCRQHHGFPQFADQLQRVLVLEIEEACFPTMRSLVVPRFQTVLLAEAPNLPKTCFPDQLQFGSENLKPCSTIDRFLLEFLLFLASLSNNSTKLKTKYPCSSPPTIKIHQLMRIHGISSKNNYATSPRFHI
jgi:hypothetical protein